MCLFIFPCVSFLNALYVLCKTLNCLVVKFYRQKLALPYGYFIVVESQAKVLKTQRVMTVVLMMWK